VQELSANNDGDVRGARPENLIWIFGHGRTGSSWLTRMMVTLPGHTHWDEPLVGLLFGYLYYERPGNRTDEHFILGGEKKVRSEPIRALVLAAVANRFSGATEEGYLVIKEPHGALGAPLLMEALPESRLIFLVRDPRDVVASHLDAHRKGSWGLWHPMADDQPEAFVADKAQEYLRDMEHVREAYDNHAGPKVLIRYEDLRADALGTMRHLYSVLKIPAEEQDLAWAVEKHSWENISDTDKGPGRVRRRATPGGWKEDLTPEQVAIVEGWTVPLLDEFYSPGERDRTQT
jgi:hypothetical protein